MRWQKWAFSEFSEDGSLNKFIMFIYELRFSLCYILSRSCIRWTEGLFFSLLMLYGNGWWELSAEFVWWMEEKRVEFLVKWWNEENKLFEDEEGVEWFMRFIWNPPVCTSARFVLWWVMCTMVKMASSLHISEVFFDELLFSWIYLNLKLPGPLCGILFNCCPWKVLVIHEK